MDEDESYVLKRQNMVDEQLRDRGIVAPRVLKAMEEIPRQLFVLPEHRHLAYADGPLPIGSGQTISQPYIVALMTQLLGLNGTETVLEVGTGSGYQAAVLSRLASSVHTIERHPDLARRAAQVLKELGLDNVFVHVGDGSLGLPENAPYQAILVTAAAPEASPSLLDQLDDGGRLVIPVGGSGGQSLELWQRRGQQFEREILVPVAFVPLRGKLGWKDDYWEESR